MRTLHLFAGAGGGLLADLILGHEPVCAVEFDPYCCAVLRERAADGWFPDLHVHEGDARLFDPSEWQGRVDLVAAGFPCQDISVAGKGAGLSGERSGLWSEVRRTVSVLRPRYVFLENSPAINGRGLDRVLADLTAIGYDARWLVLGATDVGADHIRNRWWCLAWRAEDACGHVVCSADADQGRILLPRRGVDRAEGEAWTDQRDSSLLAWWSTEPALGRVVHGLAHRLDRLAAIGNGQVTLCAATAWHLLGGPIT